MKVKNLVTIRTGSHLYGLATPNSDIDLYTVYDFYNQNYRPRKQVKQHIEEETPGGSTTDHVKISVDKFIGHVRGGVPQACEVLFAKPDHYLDSDPEWEWIAGSIEQILQENLDEVLETYRRTIINFFDEDNFKKNRHGFRLLLNARDLKNEAHFDPTLTPEQAAEITRNAELPWDQREDLYKDQLWNVFR